MFDHLLELSHRDNSNKFSYIGFGEETAQKAVIEVHFTHFIWCSDYCQKCQIYMSLKNECHVILLPKMPNTSA